jgi:hypothetical protein
MAHYRLDLRSKGAQDSDDSFPCAFSRLHSRLVQHVRRAKFPLDVCRVVLLPRHGYILGRPCVCDIRIGHYLQMQLWKGTESLPYVPSGLLPVGDCILMFSIIQ